MLRRLLPSACLAAAVAALVLAAAVPSRGQDLTTDERLDRLERDLNMLQRQVYQGAPPPAAPSAGAAVNLEVRMEQLEQQMRDLTGRVEELDNRVDQLRQRIGQGGGTADMRVGQAPAADRTAAPPSGPANLAAAPAVAPPFPSAPDGNPPPQTNPPSTASAGGPVPIFGTLTPPGAAPPRPMATAVSAPAKPATASLLPVGPPDQQFDYAFKLVRKADYPAAEKALRAFVDHHPKDRLAGSAQYWLGETYFARGRYLEAAGAFAEGYKRWPNSPKAADDLLKLGVALARANQKQNACLAFGQLNHDFPHPGTAIRERVIAERHRLGC